MKPRRVAPRPKKPTAAPRWGWSGLFLLALLSFGAGWGVAWGSAQGLGEASPWALGGAEATSWSSLPTATPPGPTPTVTPTPLRPLQPTPTWVPTATPTTSPSPTPTPTLPPRAAVQGVRSHPQIYNLSCEAAAAVDWAAFFGVSISEQQFQARLPRSDNPNKGFVGRPNGPWGLIPPRDYGVHAPPVAALLRKYGLPARAVRGMDKEALQREVAAGRPVVVWLIGTGWAGTPVRYRARDGEVVQVAPYEHVVLVVGYTPNTVTILSGGARYRLSWRQFLRSWRVLGKMAVVWAPEEP